jgi:hypothetical protein
MLGMSNDYLFSTNKDKTYKFSFQEVGGSEKMCIFATVKLLIFCAMDFENTDLSSLEFDVDSVLSDDNERWDELLDQIMAGNVIPVIGPDFQTADNENFHVQLIEFFASK